MSSCRLHSFPNGPKLPFPSYLREKQCFTFKLEPPPRGIFRVDRCSLPLVCLFPPHNSACTFCEYSIPLHVFFLDEITFSADTLLPCSLTGPARGNFFPFLEYDSGKSLLSARPFGLSQLRRRLVPGPTLKHQKTLRSIS